MRLFLSALLILCLIGLAACREGTDANAPNVIPLVVRTPHFAFNRLLVSVTVCEPGTDRCATIDDIMVDTGSTGLRLEADAVPASLHLPPHVAPDHKAMAECVRFVHDNAWGNLYRADLHLGGLVAHGLPIQIIGAGLSRRSETCPVSGARATANGTLGLGQHATDCWADCRQGPVNPMYYTCDAEACAPVIGRVDKGYRLPNPVSLFAQHDNGVVFDLPAVPAGGARVAVGTLTFGVGTSDNNRLGSARILPLDSGGFFTTLYEGRSYPDSYIDSGTETYVVPDNTLPRCRTMTWAFCASPSIQRLATLTGRDGPSIPMAFQIGDFQDTQTRQAGADSEAAVADSPFVRSFVWGAPFFLGKRLFLVFDGASVPGSGALRGPFYAIR